MIQVTRRPTTPAAATEPAGLHHARLAAMAHQVAASRRRTLWVAAAAAIAAILCGLATLDYFLELSIAVRAVGWGVALLLVGAVVWSLRNRLRYAAADAAAAMESAWPEVGQRIRTSHDYRSPHRDVAPADPGLVAALDSEAGRSVHGRAFEPLLKRWPLRLAWGGLGLVLLGWVTAAFAVTEFRISTARALLLPANYTEVEIEKLPDNLMLGERLSVAIDVRGRPLREAKVWQRNLIEGGMPESIWTPVEVHPERPGPLVGRLAAAVEPQQSLQLRIEAGPQRHPLRTVIVRQPLTIEGWTAQVEPPAYTGLPVADGQAEAFSVPAGSSLRFQARYNRAPEQVTANVDPDSAGKSLRHTLDQQAATVSLTDVRHTFALRLRAESLDGVRDESYPLRVRVVPDEPPLVAFSSPSEDAEALPTQEVSFAVDARDDYGLSRIGIVYKINGGEEVVLWEQSLEENSAELRHAAILPLEDMGLSFHDAITYYGFAVDNRPDPQRTLSELRFLDIRPFRREYEVQDAGSGNCSGECLALEKLIEEQRGILQRTFAAQLQDRIEQGPKLAKAESELQDKLESLAGALAEAVGPVPSLETAVGMMSLASDSLRAQDLAGGVAMEEGALADMILARQNLRKILKQGTSSSKQAKQIDRRQTQQLRLPEKKQDTQQEQLGDLRRELEQLAKEQEQFAESASQLSRGQASSVGEQSAKGDDQQASSQGGRQQSAPSRVKLVERQVAATKRAGSLRGDFASGEFGELAERRMKGVQDLIDGSARQLAAERDDSSVQDAQRAASELMQLSEHLARRNDPDADRQLANAQRSAERLAGDQRALNEAMRTGSGEPAHKGAGRDASAGNTPQKPQAGGGSGGSELQDQQRRLAGRGEELADLLDQMRSPAGSNALEAARSLTPALEAHRPAEAVAAMRAAAEKLQVGQRLDAARDGQRAEQDLRRLAMALRDVLAERGNAKLERLVEAERRAGELTEALRRQGSPAEQAFAAAQAQEFAESIQPLAQADETLNDALAALQALLQRQTGVVSAPTEDAEARGQRPGVSGAKSGPSSDATGPQQVSEPDEAAAAPPQTAFEGMRKVNVILQKRIQETVLEGSFRQTDQAVPTEYIRMVEEYYRTLSQDIE